MSRLIFFFFNDTATTEIYTLSLHDALPISQPFRPWVWIPGCIVVLAAGIVSMNVTGHFHPVLLFILILGMVKGRSEEHTSELQSHSDLVCRLLLEKKKIAGRDVAHGECYYS